MTDSGLAILGLLGELGAASGYGVAAVARARGMERWAGLSATSVYKGLHRLVEQQLVLAKPDARKSGRGPVGRSFQLTPAGRRRVRQALRDALEQAPEQSVRFLLALAFVGLIEQTQAVARLRSRSEALAARMRDVQRAENGMAGGPSPMGAQLVFAYALHGLAAECQVTDVLLALLNEQAGGS